MNKQIVKNSCKAFLWSIFLPQIVAILLIMLLSLFFEDTESMQNSLVYVFAMTIVAQVCFFGIYYFFAKKNKIDCTNKTKNAIKTLSIKNVLLCILISVIAVFGLFMFINIFTEFAQKIGYRDSGIGLPINTFGWFLVNVLVSAVLPAIMEELVFRGIIFKGLKKCGFWFGAIVSSTMFMIVHLSLGSTIYPIIMGLIFCLVVEKTGSVIYSMIIHFCNNFIVLLIEYISTVLGKNILPVLNLWWQYILAIVVAIIAVGLIYYIIKKWLNCKNEQQKQACLSEENQLVQSSDENLLVLSREEKLATTYTLIIGFAFWLIMVISSLA